MTNLEIFLDRVSVDFGLVRVLHHLSLSVRGSEHFAVVGDNGAGKTTLLRLLVGELWPSQRSGGERWYHVFGERSASPIEARTHMRLVTPTMADWYQRHDIRVPVWEVICAGLFNTPFLYQEPSEQQRIKAQTLGLEMGLEHVLDRPMRAISTGQAKRALLARALIAEPKLLAVDELTQGLDRQGQWQLLDALSRIAATGRTRLVVSGHGLLPVPEEVTGRIYLHQGHLVDTLPGTKPKALVLPDKKRDVTKASSVVHVDSCTVVLEGHSALKDIDWTVQAGQRWAVLGANGSGKSTLLQLITGYRRAWPGGEVSWFGHPGLENLTTVRSRIGILAPWIGERIEPDALCRDVLLSGFCAGLGVHRGLTKKEIEQMESLVDAWGMHSWLDKPFHAFSYGQVRQVMLARSVIHGPEFLVLDEPFSGLDQVWQERMALLLSNWIGQGRTLVMATHSPELMDDLLTHGIFLCMGQIGLIDTWPHIRVSDQYHRLFRTRA